jgi:hypothetical protein
MVLAGKLELATTMCGISTSLGDPDQVARGLDAELLAVDVLVDRVGRHVADEQRIAVGRGFCRGLEGDIAVRARAVPRRRLCPSESVSFAATIPRDDVGGAAGRRARALTGRLG